MLLCEWIRYQCCGLDMSLSCLWYRSYVGLKDSILLLSLIFSNSRSLSPHYLFHKTYFHVSLYLFSLESLTYSHLFLNFFHTSLSLSHTHTRTHTNTTLERSWRATQKQCSCATCNKLSRRCCNRYIMQASSVGKYYQFVIIQKWYKRIVYKWSVISKTIT